MIAILGYSITGKAVARLLDTLSKPYLIFDQNPQAGGCPHFDLATAKRCHTVIHSPGIQPNHPWLQIAQQAGCHCMNDLDFTAPFWKGPIIGITGTNGKTSLTRFLTHAFNQLEVEAYAAGNIGTSPADLISKGIVEGTLVCEISSFQALPLHRLQLEGLLWTNHAPDHLDVHGSQCAYFEAKWNLIKRLKPGAPLVVGQSVEACSGMYGKVLPAQAQVIENTSKPLLKASCFEASPQNINYHLARALWTQLGYPEGTLQAAAETFRLAPYTLQKLASLQGITFWNDAKCTNYLALEAALKAFSQPVIWIGGGKQKGGTLEPFGTLIGHNVKQAFLIGEVAEGLSAQCATRNVPATVCKNLREAVFKAFTSAHFNDNIVFSPGFSSLDLFENYLHRGQCFENEVAHLSFYHPSS